MSPAVPDVTQQASPVDFPIPVVCPTTKQPLVEWPDGRITLVGGATPPEGGAFRRADGIVDVVVGYRFEDDAESQCLCNEETNLRYTAEQYWRPLFQRLFPNRHGGAPEKGASLLAMGCGVGLEVDVLRDAGFNCVGVDCGNRSKVWNKRDHPYAMMLANGMQLPFEDGAFDAAFCGCVFPHVGVVGDSFTVADDYQAQRDRMAAEMARVVKPGGHIVVSSPNRRFPLDIFHGRAIGDLIPRRNKPWDPFLLSKGDYAKMFGRYGCDGATCESIAHYWGFCRTRKSLKGKLVGLPVKAVFVLGSWGIFKPLRSTPLLPWIVVRVRRQSA